MTERRWLVTLSFPFDDEWSVEQVKQHIEDKMNEGEFFCLCDVVNLTPMDVEGKRFKNPPKVDIPFYVVGDDSPEDK